MTGIPLPPGLQGIGIPWFSKEEWRLAREYMKDRDTFHDSYTEFVTRVEAAERTYRGRGIALIRIPIVKDQFIAWCEQRGREVDARSRAEYAAVKAQEHDSRAG